MKPHYKRRDVALNAMGLVTVALMVLISVDCLCRAFSADPGAAAHAIVGAVLGVFGVNGVFAAARGLAIADEVEKVEE